LGLLEHHWFITSPKIIGTACGVVMSDTTGRLKPGDPMPEGDPEQEEALFQTWLHEQMAALEAGAGAPESAAEPETDKASAPVDQQVARPLTDLVRLIKKQLRLGEEAADPHWLEVGKLLHEAKAQLDHGVFGGWCKEHFGISATQRARYMKAAESAVQNFRNGKFDSLEDHLKGTSYANGSTAASRGADPRAAYARLEAFVQDAAEHAGERDLRRKLLLKLIDRGYKSLAAELHPDKGGSTEAMTRLNEVRDAVKRCTTGIGVF
jgi:hypothetical protein